MTHEQWSKMTWGRKQEPMTWGEVVMKHNSVRTNGMLKKNKCSVLLMSFVLIGTLMISCSSEEQNAKAVIESGLEAFYKNDSTTFRSLLDSTTLALVDSLVYTNGLVLHNSALDRRSVSRRQGLDSLSFDCEVQIAHAGTSFFKIAVMKPDGNDKLYFDEEALFNLLKFEGEICNNIGKILFRGRMDRQSVRWFMQAKAQNVTESKSYLGTLYMHERRFTDAITVLEEAYNDGYKPALARLELALTLSGQKEKAIALLKREIAKDNVDAMVQLGFALDVRPPPNFDMSLESFYWFKMAAERGNTDGMDALADFYLSNSDRFDDDSAFYWYNKSATLGSTNAIKALGQIYIEGEYVEKDFDKGWNLLLEAAKIDPGGTYYTIGLMYEYGNGVPIDKSKALEYYKAAARNGSEIAKDVVKDFEKKQ
jgi:TPR repeat protein